MERTTAHNANRLHAVYRKIGGSLLEIFSLTQARQSFVSPMALQESDKTGPVFIMSRAIVSVPNLKN